MLSKYAALLLTSVRNLSPQGPPYYCLFCERLKGWRHNIVIGRRQDILQKKIVGLPKVISLSGDLTNTQIKTPDDSRLERIWQNWKHYKRILKRCARRYRS